MSIEVVDVDIWNDAVVVADARGRDPSDVKYISQLYTQAGGRFVRSNPGPPTKRRPARDAAADFLAQAGIALSEDGELATETVDEPEHDPKKGVDAELRGSLLTSAAYKGEDDKELVFAAAEELRSGETDGPNFRLLIETYQPYMFAVAQKVLRNKALAQDAVSHAYGKLLRNLDRYNGDAAFSTWLYRVVYNSCLDTWRRENKGAFNAARAAREGREVRAPVVKFESLTGEEGDVDLEDEQEDALSGIERRQEEDAARAEKQKAWRIAKRNLTATQIEVLELRHPELASSGLTAGDAQGMSYKEIAAHLDVPMGTVMRRLFDARKHFGEVTGVAIPKDKRGGGTGMRTNPLSGRDLLAYCETAQDARDLGEAGVLSKSEVRSVIRALREAQA